MPAQLSESGVPFDVRRQIETCREEFENAWRLSGTPRIEDFLTRVPQVGRANLLRELVALELRYRRDQHGAPLSESQLIALHPDLMADISRQLDQSADVTSRANGQPDQPLPGAKTRRPAGSTKEAEPTIDHTPKSRTHPSGSRGLHIRCPHCSNPVELLSDTPLENITCRTCGSIFSLVGDDEPTREMPVLKKIGRFELVSRIGIGGFGTVWKARDTELDRTVAVKIPRKGQLQREEIEQFLREARSAAQLRHPNIVPVHEVGRAEDTIFIVSDLIRGVSLSDWLSGATPGPREAAELLATISDALQHAHEKGVIHRDLKPSNILLDDAGQPYVMDFGLAKREVGEITMTIEGNILGTPAYMSPEQAAGEGHWTDRRTDVYSLGVILFRMLTGELPFRGNAQMQIHQRLNEDAPDPRTLNGHLPRDLCIISLKCMERDPNRRFASAKELADELRRFLANEPILSRPASRVERLIRWAKRKPALAAAMTLTMILAVAGPLVAAVMTGLHLRLNEKIKENNGLIAEKAREASEAVAQRDELRDQLDVWEGKANPFERIWPPKQNQPPRRLFIADVQQQADAILAARLRDGKYDEEQTARGYFALAALAEAAGKSEEARENYQHARDALVALRERHPDNPQFAKAAADCMMRLAKLEQGVDAEMAAKEQESARAIYRQLAAEEPTNPTSQIGWLEAEMAAALVATPAERDRHLKRVQTINSTWTGNWPTQPDALYRLACYLTETEPTIAPPFTNPRPPAAANPRPQSSPDSETP